MKPELPTELILGMTENEWPVATFTNQAHALVWIQQDPKRRHLWRARIHHARELIYVPPGEGTLTEGPPESAMRQA